MILQNTAEVNGESNRKQGKGSWLNDEMKETVNEGVRYVWDNEGKIKDWMQKLLDY